MSALWRVREVTRLMHARADAATSGPWLTDVREDGRAWIDAPNIDGHAFALHGQAHDAEHIASLDPEVARRIADLLDVLTDADWPYLACDDEPCEFRPCVLVRRAQALADAYLGAES